MMRSKNRKKGFTLVEVLFALAILGSILTPLILNQTRFLGRVIFQSELIYRVFASTQYMVESFMKFEQNSKQRTATKTIDNPQTTLKFNIAEPRESIKKSFPDLYKEEVVMEWEEEGKTSKHNILTFIFVPGLEKS